MRAWWRVVAVVVVIGAGCSSDDTDGAEPAGAAVAEVFTRAADATAALSAARFRSETASDAFVTVVEGVVQPARSGLAATVRLQLPEGVSPSDITRFEAETPSEVVAVDGTWFVRGGRAFSIARAIDRPQPGASEWFVVDRSAVRDSLWLSTPDLATLVALLRAAKGSPPEQVGREDVRDTSTTHWRATVTPRELAAGLGVAAIGALSGPDLAGLTIVVLDVWVDGNDVVRKAGYRVDLAAGGPAAAALDSTRRTLIGSPSRTWELWDLGTAPAIEPPAPAVDVTAAVAALPRPGSAP